jgi:hypothetical protein
MSYAARLQSPLAIAQPLATARRYIVTVEVLQLYLIQLSSQQAAAMWQHSALA